MAFRALFSTHSLDGLEQWPEDATVDWMVSFKNDPAVRQDVLAAIEEMSDEELHEIDMAALAAVRERYIEVYGDPDAMDDGSDEAGSLLSS